MLMVCGIQIAKKENKMDLMKINGTNAAEHWINPTKISRVTYTPQIEIPTPGEPTIVPPSIVVHLDSGFAINVADSAQDIVDKINKVL